MRCRIFPLVIGVAALWLTAAPAAAQLQEVRYNRFELTPFAAWSFGGAFETNTGGALGAGELRVPDSFSWGLVVSFLAHMGSAVELLYSRQDSDIEFDPAGGGAKVPLPGGFAFNYVQIGGRQEFGHSEKLRPFITGSLGINVLDPKAEGIGSSTRFSWSV
ncbi:MAG TPA: hypothetical protein VK899_03700, partial [Gemmatimonadales bacterium]|nr:hypothetical protein [Gemmatimonadales bacterium]